MTPQKPALTGTQAKLQAIQSRIREYQQVLDCDVTRLTIMIAGKNGIEAINKVFLWPPGTIPDALEQFFESVANDLVAEKMILEASQVLIKFGSQIVELENFIKEYTAGETPSIDGLDIDRLNKLQVGETCMIGVNGEVISILRIN